MAACDAFKPDVHTHSKYLPLIAAARMLLLELQYIAYLNVHDYTPRVLFMPSGLEA